MADIFNSKVFEALSLMTDKELRNRNVVYRKLCGLGKDYMAAANSILVMPQDEYATLILDGCDDTVRN